MSTDVVERDSRGKVLPGSFLPSSGNSLLIESAEELQAAIDRYFDTEEHPTMEGLAYSLGFTNRGSFYHYCDETHPYSDIAKRARSRMAGWYERHLLKLPNPAGAIFALKNMGWSDRQDIAMLGSINMQVSFDD